ncbi:MAG: HU family DNA-binding protein [Cetobacterium sp.]
MTKQKFIELFQEKMNISTKKEAEKLVNGLFLTIEEVLIKGEELSIVGFGKFETVKRAERICRNPKNGELMKSPEKKVVKFRVGKGLLEKVAKE